MSIHLLKKSFMRNHHSYHIAHKHGVNSGLTLIELLVALVLGIFLIGGILSVYSSTQQSFRATENLARMQESSRFAFEQMARELREAGTTPCGSKAVASVVRTGSPPTVMPWWADWNSGTLVGYEGTVVGGSVSFGTAVGQRVSGTDAVSILRTQMDDANLRTIQSHNTATMAIVLDSVTRYDTDDMVFACDSISAAIFEVWAVDIPSKTIEHRNSAPSNNCTNVLGWPQPANCTGTVSKQFNPGGFVSKYDPAFWYIGVGTNNRRALYRVAQVRRLVSGVNIQTTEVREMVTDVNDMQLQYLVRDKNVSPGSGLATTWINADDATFNAPNAWTTANPNEVVAVRLALTFRSPDAVGTNGQPLERRTISVISLRSRETKMP